MTYLGAPEAPNQKTKGGAGRIFLMVASTGGLYLVIMFIISLVVATLGYQNLNQLVGDLPSFLITIIAIFLAAGIVKRIFRQIAKPQYSEVPADPNAQKIADEVSDHSNEQDGVVDVKVKEITPPSAKDGS